MTLRIYYIVYTFWCVRTHGLSSCAVHEFTQKVRTTHVYCVEWGVKLYSLAVLYFIMQLKSLFIHSEV